MAHLLTDGMRKWENQEDIHLYILPKKYLPK